MSLTGNCVIKLVRTDQDMEYMEYGVQTNGTQICNMEHQP